MESPHRLHQYSLHYNNRYPTSADAFAAPQEFNNQLLFSFTTGTRRFYHSPELGGLNCLSFFLFPLSYLMETGAKNKRPQALPRAKESVMIPTLLMNIPEPAKTTTQSQISVVALGFFFPPLNPSESLSLFFTTCFFYFICYSRHGRKRRKSGKGIQHTIEDRGRKEQERKGKCPRVAAQAGRHIHTGILCCGNC